MNPTPNSIPTPTGTEAEVCADIARRQAHGMQKYGVSVADNPLTLLQWVEHLYQELLDGSVYTKRLMPILAALTARAESAVALVAEKDKALEFIRDECDWEVGGDHFVHGGDSRIGPACTAALALTPASMVSLRDTACKYAKSHNEFIQVSGCETPKELSLKLDSMVSKLAELEKENAWLKTNNELLVFAGLGSLGGDRGKNAVADMIDDMVRKLAELEKERDACAASRNCANSSLLAAEARAERLAEVLRVIRDMGFPTHDRPSADVLYKHVEIARSALADQPAPSTNDVNMIARVLRTSWEKAEPTHPITAYPDSFVATFADMARAVVDHLSARRTT